MATKVYGSNDDLIEVDGDVRGEVGCYGTDDRKKGVLLIFSDGTLLEVEYCGRVSGVWEVKLIKQGELFEKIDIQTDPDADVYSDIAHFKDGLKFAYAAKEWEPVE